MIIITKETKNKYEGNKKDLLNLKGALILTAAMWPTQFIEMQRF